MVKCNNCKNLETKQSAADVGIWQTVNVTTMAVIVWSVSQCWKVY